MSLLPSSIRSAMSSGLRISGRGHRDMLLGVSVCLSGPSWSWGAFSYPQMVGRG